MTIHRRSRRTVLATSLAATAGLVGGMAFKAIGPSAASTGATTAPAGSSDNSSLTNRLSDQASTGVWIRGDGGEADDDGFEHHEPDDGGAVFAPAVPAPAPTRTRSVTPSPSSSPAPPALSSHGS